MYTLVLSAKNPLEYYNLAGIHEKCGGGVQVIDLFISAKFVCLSIQKKPDFR